MDVSQLVLGELDGCGSRRFSLRSPRPDCLQHGSIHVDEHLTIKKQSCFVELLFSLGMSMAARHPFAKAVAARKKGCRVRWNTPAGRIVCSTLSCAIAPL